MRKIYYLLIMVFCLFATLASVSAETYSANINGISVKIVLKPGPFGPGESGSASLLLNKDRYDGFDYEADFYGDLEVIRIPGLCILEVLNNHAEVFFYTGMVLQLEK